MKNIFDLSHVKSVTAWALTNDKGESLGRVIANWSDNPNGSVCTCAVHLWPECMKALGIPAEREDTNVLAQGTAGGGGYDKFAAAVISAMRRRYGFEYEEIKQMDGGTSCVRKWFEDRGVKVIEVC